MKKSRPNHFYRLSNNTKLFSFGDPIQDIRVGNLTLKEHQDTLIASVGGKVIDIQNLEEINESSGYYYFDEDLFFTLEFLKKATLSRNNSRFCLKINTFNSRYILPHATNHQKEIIRFNFFYVEKTNQKNEEVIIEQNIYINYVELPQQIVKGRNYHMDQCDTFASHIISPFHLLHVNLALNLNRTIKLQKYLPKKWRSDHGTKLAFRALRFLNKIGKNVKIHPTAIIEGSIIGDNSIIGANAIVRLSHIGKKCSISENVSVINSILGDRTYISNSNYILNCLTYDEVFLIHGPYQFSIFGKNSACFAVINADIRLDQENIKIPTSLGIIDSNQPLLGIAYGHHSKTGGGNIIASGRIVPNHRIINPPDNIILKFD